jgi:hypothetical protein
MRSLHVLSTFSLRSLHVLSTFSLRSIYVLSTFSLRSLHVLYVLSTFSTFSPRSLHVLSTFSPRSLHCKDYSFDFYCLQFLVFLLPKTFTLFCFQIFWLWTYLMKSTFLFGRRQYLFILIHYKDSKYYYDTTDTHLCVKSLSVTCERSVLFSEYSVSSTNKTDLHDIAEILLKVAWNTITLTLFSGVRLQTIEKRFLIFPLTPPIIFSFVLWQSISPNGLNPVTHVYLSDLLFVNLFMSWI